MTKKFKYERIKSPIATMQHTFVIIINICSSYNAKIRFWWYLHYDAMYVKFGYW
jgi:hypothetical protein